MERYTARVREVYGGRDREREGCEEKKEVCPDHLRSGKPPSPFPTHMPLYRRQRATECVNGSMGKAKGGR
ncbi:hypothetical protein QQF64_009917 [Cirrhinus molitorella]|uniref:Uncharacterized protein n=1 Tax=Cirrhinus molitorella TaxID=172907 RepID=A0ABR3M2H6_9TELE